MQEREKLQEIENIGEDEELEELEEERRAGGTGTVPILQLMICALVLAALVFLKCTDREKYDAATQWYQKEAAQEIELPQWGAGNASPSPAPSPTPLPSEAPPTVNLDGEALQRV